MSKQDRTGGSVPPPGEPTKPDGGLIPSKQMSTLPEPEADAAWGPVNALSPEEAAAKRKRLQERWDADRRKPQPEAEPKHDPKVKLERKKQPETFEFGENAAKAVNLPRDFGIGAVPRLKKHLDEVELTVGGEGTVNMQTGGQLPQVTLVFANPVDRAVFGMELGPEKYRGQFADFLTKNVDAKQLASGLMGRIMKNVVVGQLTRRLASDQNKTIADGDVFTIPTVFTVHWTAWGWMRLFWTRCKVVRVNLKVRPVQAEGIDRA